jgi:actin-like ATPase involved in cell morphogenesis
MKKTKIGSSVEDKLEAIIKVIKKEFPELAPSSQAEILQSAVVLTISG